MELEIFMIFVEQITVVELESDNARFAVGCSGNSFLRTF